jgi:hypothetical protein
MKEGPYDWVPPGYWYDNTHSSNNANDNDSTLTNVGGAWAFDNEQSAGDTVPTMDSVQRFLSPPDQAALWQQSDAHQYHTNYESTDGSHSGYSFGTLDNLDTAIQNRYGKWGSLAQFVELAQVQNYEDTRAQFEAFIDHWNNSTPSTGTVYWQLNKGWPTLLWDLYNNDYDQAGSYFGAKKANEDLHVLYAYDTGTVTVDNLSGAGQQGLSVESRVYNLAGHVLDDQTASGISLDPQAVQNAVLRPRVPATTTPPAPAQTYFVELTLRQHGTVLDRNVYWLSTQQDVIDWTTTEGNPQADNGSPLSQYANMTALQKLPSEPVQVSAVTTGSDGDRVITSVTITNPSSNPAVAFFLRADMRRGNANDTAQSGGNHLERQRHNAVAGGVRDADRVLPVVAARRRHAGGERLRLERAERHLRRGGGGAGRGRRRARAALRRRRRYAARPWRRPARQRSARDAAPGHGSGSRDPGERRRRPGCGVGLDHHLGGALAGHDAARQLHPRRQRRHLHADRDEHRPCADRREDAGDARRHRRPEPGLHLRHRIRLDLRLLQQPDDHVR